MITRIWRIGFGTNWSYITVTASNVSQAIRKARHLRKGELYNRIQDINGVQLLAETEN